MMTYSERQARGTELCRKLAADVALPAGDRHLG